MIEHKETCLKINGKQSAKLKSGSIEIKYHSKHLAVPFKIFSDFECNVKAVKSNDKNNASCTKKDQDHFPCSFVCIDDKRSKTVVLYRGKNVVNEFIEAILKDYDYFKKINK